MISDSCHYCLDGIRRPTKLSAKIDLSRFDLSLLCTVTHGHGVASRASAKYPQGTISLQYPLFRDLGLDLGHCYGGTLNLSIAPRTYRIINPLFSFRQISWHPALAQPENFFFCECAVTVSQGYIFGYIYQPDPASKTEHFDNPCVLQIISPFIEGLDENTAVMLYMCSTQIQLSNK